MNKTNRLLVWSLIILVLMNAGLLATIWLKPASQAARTEMGNEGGPANFIIDKLHLSAEQVKEFDILRGRHHDSIEMLQRDGHELRKQFFDQLKQESSDTASINTLSTSIAENQRQIELVTYKHFAQVRQICDPEQKKIFDEIIDEILMRMSHRRPPPPSPGDNGRQMPPRQ